MVSPTLGVRIWENFLTTAGEGRTELAPQIQVLRKPLLPTTTDA
jgi:hypothetical protein